MRFKKKDIMLKTNNRVNEQVTVFVPVRHSCYLFFSILYECIWVQGPRCFSYLSTSLYLFKCLLAQTACLSLPRRPTDSCHLTRCLLTSCVHLLLGLTSVTLTYSPPAQAMRLSVDLSSGHKSGKLQWGKIRELSLTGICVGWISGRWARDCSVFDL